MTCERSVWGGVVLTCGSDVGWLVGCGGVRCGRCRSRDASRLEEIVDREYGGGLLRAMAADPAFSDLVVESGVNGEQWRVHKVGHHLLFGVSGLLQSSGVL